MEPKEQKDQEDFTERRPAPFGTAGLVVSLIAVAAAVVSPWIIEALAPEPKPIDEEVADAVMNFKDRMIAKAKGEEFKPPPEEEPEPDNSKWVMPATLLIAVCGMSLGVVGFVRHENPRVNGCAVVCGISAILFQYLLIAAIVVMLIMALYVVLSALGVDPLAVLNP